MKNTDWKFDKEEKKLVKIRFSIKKNVFWAFVYIGPHMFETVRDAINLLALSTNFSR